MILLPLSECNFEDVYEMYQDIPSVEFDFINPITDVVKEEFENIYKEYVDEENSINPKLNTKTSRFILVDDNKYIGYVGIRTTLNDFLVNKGSQLFYQIRLSERRKGYGFNIVKLALMEAKRMGFNKIRVNCDNNNIPSKKIIIRNGGVIDIKDYKMSIGISSSYVINL